MDIVAIEMMDKIKVRVNAKINLTLDVLGMYGACYHDLDMVMASVGIYDVVECAKSDKITVTMNGRVSGENNSAYKAAKACFDRYGVGLVKVDIHKGIPFSAGMGGSSADAAAVLYCIGRLYDISYDELHTVACEVGSDVSFMLNGGIRRARGKGDDLTELAHDDYCLVVVKGRGGCSTAQVFAQFDTSPTVSSHTADYVRAGADRDARLASIGNGLQNAAMMENPEIERAIRELSQYTPHVSMTGSGSAVYGIFPDMESANSAVRMLKRKFVYCKACKVLDYGIKIV